jgi:hypothetical protein
MAWGKSRLQSRIAEATLPVLEPGEQVVASADAMSGPNPLLMAELLGIWGRMLFQKRYFLTVTDRRVIFIKGSMLTNKGKGLAFAYPRSNVEVVGASKGLVYYVVKLRIQGQKDIRLNFHRIWRQEAEGIAAAIGSRSVAPA